MGDFFGHRVWGATNLLVPATSSTNVALTSSSASWMLRDATDSTAQVAARALPVASTAARATLATIHRLLFALIMLATTAARAAAPPGYPTIQRLSNQALGTRGSRAHGRGVPVGDGRFFSLVHYKKKSVEWSVALVQLQRQGTKWALTGSWPMPMTSSVTSGNPYAPAALCPTEGEIWKPASALLIKDFDHDGKPELLLRLKFCWLVAAIGDTSIRTMQLYNLETNGLGKRAFFFEIDQDGLPTAMGRTLGRPKFEDLDGDGHPDIRMRMSFTSPDTFMKGPDEIQCVDYWERRFIWEKKTDRYVERSSKDEQHHTRRCQIALEHPAQP